MRMKTRMRVAASISFIAGALGYLVLMVGCLGSGVGSGVSDACSTIGGALRVPFLYLLPHAQSRYLGIDSAVLAVLGNAIFWGMALTLLVLVGLRVLPRNAD